MFKRIAISMVTLLLGACDVVPDQASFCDSNAQSAVSAMVNAHGGIDAWRELKSIYVEREHLFAGSERPIRFSILGEYPSHRIFQSWLAPSGTLAWDGERAWSSDWALADRLMPRYVAAIGFYLVNMPWLAYQDATRLETRGCGGRLPGHGDRQYLVIEADYEPDPVRKPAWYEGPRDSYELYIDPDSHRLSGVMQHWTYAGQLDTAGAPPSVEAISQLFVEVNGLIWPEAYSAYTPEGEVAAHGRFFDYDFSRPLDTKLLFADDTGSVKTDNSSSYFRKR
jgi:hypothetical protein